jgi:hypothetical protein
MNKMARLRMTRYRVAMVALCFALVLVQACSRSEPMRPGDANASSSSGQQHLPFHPDVQPASVTESVNTPPKLAGGLPFRKASRPRVLPPGTLLTVELDQALSADSVHAGDAFAASLAAPLMIDGETLIERGTEVTGRVEAAQSRHGSGYVQLSLSAIRVDGTLLPLETSSLFARGTVRNLKVSSGNPPTQILGGTRVPKGRRLTFRLSAPASLEELSSREKSPSSNTSSE